LLSVKASIQSCFTFYINTLSSALSATYIHRHTFHTTPANMTRVLLTGGSGFIAAHVLDILLQHGHSVVTTVRSQEKANKIKEAHSKYGKEKLDFAIVEDIAQEGAFDKAVVSDPPFETVIHTASPFHFNVTNVQKVRTWKCKLCIVR
jgi:NADPH:quinone reductase-like Zn-dependent oxidoreductase